MNKVGHQINPPQKGEEIAIISTTMGEIKLRFFKDEAPKAVENFKEHAKNGYYDNVIFHRIIENFMIQTGDPEGTGCGGESIWNKPFEDEFSLNLFNIRGSVAMANSGKNTNGSQFFINQANKDSFRGWRDFQHSYSVFQNNPSVFTKLYGGTLDISLLTDEIKELYDQHGGNPHLDGALNTDKRGHTVFAQVFEGIDIVDKIASAPVDTQNRPQSEIKIENIKIQNF